MKTYPKTKAAGGRSSARGAGPAVVATLAATLIALVFSGSAMAASLDQIFQAAERINGEARSSQKKIDGIIEDTQKVINEYKTILKEVDGLRVYNAQLQKQINSQNAEMAQINESIDGVTVIERQIVPLMLRMIDGLEQFVELDVPFRLQERKDRVERLRTIMDRADVAVSEKLSQIFNAYQIENDYGRTMGTYSDTIDGKIVDVFRLGRVVLAYQTSDGAASSRWNSDAGNWETLDPAYNTQIRNGIRMANKQLTLDLIRLPISGPK